MKLGKVMKKPLYWVTDVELSGTNKHPIYKCIEFADPKLLDVALLKSAIRRPFVIFYSFLDNCIVYWSHWNHVVDRLSVSKVTKRVPFYSWDGLMDGYFNEVE